MFYFFYLQEMFVLHDYMADQPTLNTNMRAILVDWLVEVQVCVDVYWLPRHRFKCVQSGRMLLAFGGLSTDLTLILLFILQENFELNHETLYLAVKVTDHYLAVSPVRRESLQLIGSTAMLIASKFEVRHMLSLMIAESHSFRLTFLGLVVIAQGLSHSPIISHTLTRPQKCTYRVYIYIYHYKGQ